MKKIKMQIVIRPYCKKELARLYGISAHILNGWLKLIDEALGQYTMRMYNIRQVKLIFETFGIPGQEIEIE